MYNPRARFTVVSIFAVFAFAAGCDETGWDGSSAAPTQDDQLQSLTDEAAAPCARGEGCDCGCADGEPCDCAKKGACGCGGHGGDGMGKGACGCGAHAAR